VVLLMSGRSMWTLFNSMIGLGINVGLNLWLIPKYGMEGAALAWSASIVFNNLAGIIEVKALLKLSPFGPGSAIPMVASVVCFGGLGLLTRHVFGMTLGTFVVFGLVTTLVYGGLLYVFRRRLHLGILLQAVRARGGGRRMNAFG
jgi:O-antigen/teichoic acid export membrane protein